MFLVEVLYLLKLYLVQAERRKRKAREVFKNKVSKLSLYLGLGKETFLTQYLYMMGLAKP